MQNAGVRSGQIRQGQKDILLEFIKNQPNLQSGKFTSTFTKKCGQNLWEKVILTLNIPDGPKKNWIQWHMAGTKKNAKAKNSNIRRHAGATGGGPAINSKLTDTEYEIVNTMIVPTVIEGNNNIFESSIVFGFDELPLTQDQPLLEEQPVTKEQPLTEKQDNILNEEIDEVEMEFEVPREELKSANISKHGLKRPLKPTAATQSTSCRMTKSRRLENSLTLTKKFIGISKEKKENVENYYDQKLKLMKMKLELQQKYQENKLAVLRERNEIEREIFVTLKQIQDQLPSRC
ncbi:unnamed protein product [Brassicogethes aeneus]|uniref:Regulatory protein zeste n=1 Tax=Brassicogethes aeneus TaxID=1431903 RepID=A0A9P0BCY0_BRAAE|nr:unnamed protein product [Brassicogethes aeneus]